MCARARTRARVCVCVCVCGLPDKAAHGGYKLFSILMTSGRVMLFHE